MVAPPCFHICAPRQPAENILGAYGNIKGICRKVSAKKCGGPVIEKTQIRLFNEFSPYLPLGVGLPAPPRSVVRVNIANNYKRCLQAVKQTL